MDKLAGTQGINDDNGAPKRRRLAFVVEYDGTNYSGFQLQVTHSTIQGELEKAAAKLTGEKVRVRGASRTDAGAHARGQVVDFRTSAPFSTETFQRGLNFYLPPDIKVRQNFEVELDFNARRDAVGRMYRYTMVTGATPSPLWRDFAHWVRPPLNVRAMASAARTLEGTHDFTPLAAPLRPGRSGVRRVERWRVYKQRDLVMMDIKANGFLPHQIRKSGSLLLGVGMGRLQPRVVADVLNGVAEVPPWCAVLPAKGLCLLSVCYKDFPPEESRT